MKTEHEACTNIRHESCGMRHESWEAGINLYEA